MVPINEPAEEGGTVTMDVVELMGSKKQRKKQWRRYLQTRTDLFHIHDLNKVTRALGFTELL